MAKGQASRRRKVVPGCESVIDQWKYEIAAELGLPVGQSVDLSSEFASELGSIPAGSSVREDYWGHIASRDAGAVGGHITARLIRQAEQTLGGLSLD